MTVAHCRGGTVRRAAGLCCAATAQAAQAAALAVAQFLGISGTCQLERGFLYLSITSLFERCLRSFLAKYSSSKMCHNAT